MKYSGERKMLKFYEIKLIYLLEMNSEKMGYDLVIESPLTHRD